MLSTTAVVTFPHITAHPNTRCRLATGSEMPPLPTKEQYTHNLGISPPASPLAQPSRADGFLCGVSVPQMYGHDKERGCTAAKRNRGGADQDDNPKLALSWGPQPWTNSFVLREMAEMSSSKSHKSRKKKHSNRSRIKPGHPHIHEPLLSSCLRGCCQEWIPHALQQ